MTLELIIPRSAADRRRYYTCFCGKAFPLDQKVQWVRHVKRCAKRHEDEIAEGAERRHSHPFKAPLDRELYDHIRQGGN